jgi:hypothetical protein
VLTKDAKKKINETGYEISTHDDESPRSLCPFEVPALLCAWSKIELTGVMRFEKARGFIRLVVGKSQQVLMRLIVCYTAIYYFILLYIVYAVKNNASSNTSEYLQSIILAGSASQSKNN